MLCNCLLVAWLMWWWFILLSLSLTYRWFGPILNLQMSKDEAEDGGRPPPRHLEVLLEDGGSGCRYHRQQEPLHCPPLHPVVHRVMVHQPVQEATQALFIMIILQVHGAVDVASSPEEVAELPSASLGPAGTQSQPADEGG
ncbi:hypothetical protein SAY86_000644 [Trapa natans]|uniref:Uncharacterized protein n=1 Tax=Trapa natans TaxID=22666 RepID=A0AAN7RLM8_TRANT|nr:hypothetical protein SAY86_000644 [Trapa natans]